MIVSCDVVQRPPKNIGLLLLTLKECGSRLCADGAEKVADFIKIIERAEFCERVCIKERENGMLRAVRICAIRERIEENDVIRCS